MALTSAQQDLIVKTVVGVFDAATGVTYLDLLSPFANNQGGLVAALVNTDAFKAIYPETFSNEQFASKYLNALVGDTVSAENKANVAAYAAALLNGGASRANVVLALINALDHVDPVANPDWANAATAFHNQVTVAKYYTVEQVGSATSLATLQSVTADVTYTTDVSTEAAIKAVINESGNTPGFALTNGIDTATANVFNSVPVYTPGGNDFINSLQDEDHLTGTGTNPTLNVTLGSPNDNAEGTVTPILTNIQTVNVQVTGGANKATGINFQDATGLTTLNVTRITASNADVSFDDLDATVTNLGLSNSTRDGSVTFDYREDALTSTEDTLNVTLTNVRNNAVNITEGGDTNEDKGYGFETVNITVNGGANIDNFTLAHPFTEGTEQTVNLVANGNTEINEFSTEAEHVTIVANADVLIAQEKAPVGLLASSGEMEDNEGLENDSLQDLTITGAGTVSAVVEWESVAGLTVDAHAQTGSLNLSVINESSGLKGDLLTITSGSANDKIAVSEGAFVGSITTNAGDDAVSIYDDVGNANDAGTIDTGAGNDTVVARDLLVTAADNNQIDNTGYDDVVASSISTGAGDDSVSVRVLGNSADWDNKSLTDGNADDLYVVKGASINTGAGVDTVSLRSVAEGASVDTGADNDVLNVDLNADSELDDGIGISFDPYTHTVLAGDTDADQVTVKTTSNAGTREVTTAEVADRLGAVVDLGAGTDDVANFAETASFGANSVTIVGRDAELRGAETVNVTALDRITVTTTTSTEDQDALTAGVQNDVNANVIGTETLNLTIANQIDARTAFLSGETQNDTFIFDTNAVITADVMRFDSALEAINLDSQEQTLLLNPATEQYEAGTRTNFVLQNLRTDIDLSLKANEATGVSGVVDTNHDGKDVVVGDLADDSLLLIDTTTGVVTADQSKADVGLTIDYDGARDLNNVAVLNVDAASGAFDLKLNIGATTTDLLDTDGDGDSTTVANAASASDDDAMSIENFTVKFADANSHSINAEGFGDVVFRGTRAPAVAGDVSSTAATSFIVDSAAGAGKTIAIDQVNADVIRVLNADGSAVTAANVVLRVDASNNYNIITGSGTDVLDLRADDVRSDDIDTALDRADHIDAGTGRDTLIVNGSDNLGSNILPTVTTTIDDDVFATIRGVEKILVDADYVEGTEVQDITLDEQAAITGVDTIALVGSDDQTQNIELGNNFVLATTVDNANGQLTTAANAFVIDASLHSGFTALNIESKDDDTDVSLINLDIRANSKGAANIDLVNTGSESARTEIRLLTADENDGFHLSSAVATTADLDGTVGLQVGAGSVDKVVILDGTTANDNSGAEAAMTIALDASWTGSAFELDASAVLDTDADTTTGGATITAAYGDTAALTISGTQNDDTVIGGRGADVINGNGGDDTIVGDEVTDQNELQVVTFAATYDAGDVVTVTHNGNTLTALITVDGTTGDALAAAFALADVGPTLPLSNVLAAPVVLGAVTVTGSVFADATSTFDVVTRQLRLTGAVAGDHYDVTATTDNALDNTPQIQTLAITDGGVTAGYDVQVVFNGVTYNFDETFNPAGSALETAIHAIDATASLGFAANVLTITGGTTGAALPLITQVLFADPADDAGALSLTAATLGTDQANPQVVTETLARTVVGAADTINGGDGNDIIAGLTGADVLDGGAGNDILDYSLSLGGVTVNLATNTASGGDAAGDTISNFEGIVGSDYNDVLTGDAGDNLLVGGGGDDVLSGGAGDDQLDGGVGSDTITGGAGNDLINLGADSVEDTVVLASGEGVDLITNFVAGTDTIKFSDFADRDLLPTSLLQQTAAFGANDAISGNNTELLVVTGAAVADITAAADIASAIGGAFNLTTLADGRVVFAVQSGADTYVGYYTDTGADDVVAAADIEVVGKVVGANLTSADFWLPAV